MRPVIGIARLDPCRGHHPQSTPSGPDPLLRSMMRASGTASSLPNRVTSRTGARRRGRRWPVRRSPGDGCSRSPVVRAGSSQAPTVAGELPVDSPPDGQLRWVAHAPQPQVRRVPASASMANRPVGPASLEMKAKVSTRPLASVTMPASELIAVSDPVLARSHPADDVFGHRRGSGQTRCRCRRRWQQVQQRTHGRLV